MDVRFTSTARDQLLTTVVALREQDRDAAWSFLRRVTSVLVELGCEGDTGVEVSSGDALDRAGDGYRILYRLRDDVVWVLAMWRDSALTASIRL